MQMDALAWVMILHQLHRSQHRLQPLRHQLQVVVLGANGTSQSVGGLDRITRPHGLLLINFESIEGSGNVFHRKAVECELFVGNSLSMLSLGLVAYFGVNRLD